MRFYLGTHHPHWLRTASVPLFVSRMALKRYKTLPRAAVPWALDSGGFTELQRNGCWTISAPDYAAEVRRYHAEIGSLEFAAPQDWMCEPDIINGKWHADPARRFVGTKLSVVEHQRRTVENFLELRALAPEIPWMPVLQGWGAGDYHRHVDDYYRAGVDLLALPRVGVGTICRRQETAMVGTLLHVLAADGLRLHAFGFKLRGLQACASDLVSADSTAWSRNARSNQPLPGHTHKNCANCIEWAMGWREDALAAIERGEQQRSLPWRAA